MQLFPLGEKPSGHPGGQTMRVALVGIAYKEYGTKGCPQKNVTAQNFEIFFSQEPFVLGGCPFHSLVYS